jgi:hypothetical protein
MEILVLSDLEKPSCLWLKHYECDLKNNLSETLSWDVFLMIYPIGIFSINRQDLLFIN